MQLKLTGLHSENREKIQESLIKIQQNEIKVGKHLTDEIRKLF